MISELVRSIPDISLIPIILMIICIVVFTGAVFYAIFARKGFVSKMGSLPLESNLNNSNDEDK